MKAAQFIARHRAAAAGLAIVLAGGGGFVYHSMKTTTAASVRRAVAEYRAHESLTAPAITALNAMEWLMTLASLKAAQ